ncbi:MAG: 23S rRNA (pseudouridine(1915)-N(3))-methyltransferase RlmH [Eggerthellaceae bacterium]|nr:23S rRNA (pseudouridine(1915)-N(3))-methyltransferase RlmH [Eggerthellaceae bacterium]
MNITVLAVGKLKEKFWVDACAEYLKRLRAYANVTIKEVGDVDPAKAGGVSGALQKEATALLTAIPARSYMILLAIKGKERSSEQLSAHLDAFALKGTSDFVFVIGGSEGVHETVIERADETLSFGPLTLPHNLARVVLLEQLYRAFKISKKEPYHK